MHLAEPEEELQQYSLSQYAAMCWTSSSFPHRAATQCSLWYSKVYHVAYHCRLLLPISFNKLRAVWPSSMGNLTLWVTIRFAITYLFWGKRFILCLHRTPGRDVYERSVIQKKLCCRKIWNNSCSVCIKQTYQVSYNFLKGKKEKLGQKLWYLVRTISRFTVKCMCEKHKQSMA